jgi:hypothetical protein
LIASGPLSYPVQRDTVTIKTGLGEMKNVHHKFYIRTTTKGNGKCLRLPTKEDVQDIQSKVLEKHIHLNQLSHIEWARSRAATSGSV